MIYIKPEDSVLQGCNESLQENSLFKSFLAGSEMLDDEIKKAFENIIMPERTPVDDFEK